MLEVQAALRNGEHTLESLRETLGIKHVIHDTLPLVILNYDQIASRPKTHPIVRECRCLTLEFGTWDLVARSFPRFFNWGEEVAAEMERFNFDDFGVESKEDGSLLVVYKYDGDWHANTRGSFGMQRVPGSQHTWRDLVPMCLDNISALEDLDVHLVGGYSYVFELATPYNRVVRSYAEPTMYLLSIFGPDGSEVSPVKFPVHEIAYRIGARRPKVFPFKSIDAIRFYLDKMTHEDPTFEGVVIRDNQNHRWKIKNASYLMLHQTRGEAWSILDTKKQLIPFALKGERDEFLTYFPEAEKEFDEVNDRIQRELDNLLETWNEASGIESQKDFAMEVIQRTRFASVLFRVRKNCGNANDVEVVFRSMDQKQIYSIIFK